MRRTGSVEGGPAFPSSIMQLRTILAHCVGWGRLEQNIYGDGALLQSAHGNAAAALDALGVMPFLEGARNRLSRQRSPPRLSFSTLLSLAEGTCKRRLP